MVQDPLFPQDHLVDPGGDHLGDDLSDDDLPGDDHLGDDLSGDDHLGDDLSDYDHLGVDLLDDDHLVDQAAVQGLETDSRLVSRSLLFSRAF